MTSFKKFFPQPILFASNLILIALVTAFAPLERTLGANVRLVYYHGAWVWAGKLAFGAAALVGLAGFGLRRWPAAPAWAARLPAWTLALGRTGLFFWVTYLPLSLLVMQLNWGGLFLDEPRFRTPLTFGIVGLLLHAGFYFLDHPDLICMGSLGYGVVLWAALGGIENILHPDSPIFTSDSLRIQLFFIILLLLSISLGGQIAVWLYQKSKRG